MAYSDAPMRIPKPGLVALPGGREASAAIGAPDRPPLVLIVSEDYEAPELDRLDLEAAPAPEWWTASTTYTGSIASYLCHPSHGA